MQQIVFLFTTKHWCAGHPQLHFSPLSNQVQNIIIKKGQDLCPEKQTTSNHMYCMCLSVHCLKLQ